MPVTSAFVLVDELKALLCVFQNSRERAHKNSLMRTLPLSERASTPPGGMSIGEVCHRFQTAKLCFAGGALNWRRRFASS